MFMVANQRHSIDFLVRCESGQSVLSYLLQIAIIMKFFRRSGEAFTFSFYETLCDDFSLESLNRIKCMT